MVKQTPQKIKRENVKELLKMVDEGKIALTPAAELSFLSKEEQDLLLLTIESEQATPSLMKSPSSHGVSALL